ncbi:MAG: Ig-like domain-containing protein [Thermoflexales bacterium]|nr:Ig-like domain-containing protein [Thermoflexales bacterium]
MTRSTRWALLPILALVLGACAPTPTASPSPTRPSATPNPPTATPRPPVNPVLVDRTPAAGEELGSDQPITLIFDQAMDKSSVERAIEMATDGGSLTPSFAWKADNILAINPAAAGWGNGTFVNVAMTTTAKSARGLSLARAESFRSEFAGALIVAQTFPSDQTTDASPDTAITVAFNRPVVPMTLLDQQSGLPSPVTFSPAISGTGQWLNTSIYVFQPAVPLASDVTYSATIKAGLRDTTGSELQKDYRWWFSVSAPVIKTVTPDPGIKLWLDRPISITFSQKMDHASAEAAFTISPTVAGHFVWANEAYEPRYGPASGPAPTGEVMAFWPDARYPSNTSYFVSVKAGARARSGGLLKATRSYAFVTVGNFEAAFYPDNRTYRDPGDSISIKFNVPPDLATILPNLRIEPPISMTRIYSYFRENDNVFSFGAPFAPSSNYTLTIGANTADRYGRTLGQPLVLKFGTEPLDAYLSLNTNSTIGTYDAHRPTRLFASYRNIGELRFTLWPLSLSEFSILVDPPSWDYIQTFVPKESGRSWTIPSDAALNESAIARVSLAADGGALTPGVYLLQASAAGLPPNRRPERHLLVVSNRQVTLKVGEGDTLVWVTDLATGLPVKDAQVSISDLKTGALTPANARTNADGVVRGQSVQSGSRYGTTIAFVGVPGQADFGIGLGRWSDSIEPWSFGLPYRSDVRADTAYLYTDRPIYRPGQQVFFKGIVRTDDDARYSVPTRTGNLMLRATDDTGQDIYTSTVTLNELGTFSGTLTLGNEAGTGYYNLMVYQDGKRVIGRVGIQVASYRRPEYEVVLTPGSSDVRDGDTLTATVEARYFFGGGVAGARVQWSLLLNDWVFDRYAGSDNYSFWYYDYNTYFRRTGYNQTTLTGEGTTGPDGKLVIRVPVDLSKRLNSASLTLEASVTDLDDNSVSARANVVAHKGPVYVGVMSDEYVVTAGKTATARLVAVDAQGKTLPNTDVQLVLARFEWFVTQSEDADGRRQYDSVARETPVLTRTARTDAQGQAAIEINIEQGGQHRLLASAVGGTQRSSSWLWASSLDGSYISWQVNNNDRIELKADKASYKVGETARILVPSPFSGTVSALVTVERGHILSQRVVTLKSNSDIVEVPIEAGYAPNAYVSVVVVKGGTGAELPSYRVGYVGFSVDPEAFKLSIAVKPDRETYRPRDTVTYDLRVTDASGKPVQAELSLAVVDKAILTLSEPNSLNILDAFYGTRGLGLWTSSSLNVNVDRVTAKIAADAGKGGGGGGPANAADGNFTREDFKDTAFWRAVVRTDSNGEARVQVTLPDNLTTWRLDVRALTANTLVGQTTHDVVSAKPLLVRPVTPRFFVVSDTLSLGAVVNNSTDAAIDAEVSLEATGVKLGGPSLQRVSVPARGSVRVNWPVSVLDAPSAQLTFAAKGGSYQDTVKPGLATAADGGIPILRYSAPETIGTAGELAQGGTRLEVVALPQRLDVNRGSLDLRVETSLAATTSQGWLALVKNDDYLSASEHASRLIATLAEMAAGRTDEARLMAQARVDIGWLEAASLPTGGWCWYDYAGCEPSLFISAYAALALGRASRRDLAVNQAVLARAMRLINNRSIGVGENTSRDVLQLQAFLAFVRAENGDTSVQPHLNRLYEQRTGLNHWARALLAMALNDVDATVGSPAQRQVQTLVGDLVGTATASATGAMWQEEEQGGWYFSTNTRSTALVIEALTRLDPKNALLPNAVRWLVTARRGDAWETDQEIAWAVSALNRWMTVSGERSAEYAWRVSVNGAAVLDGTAGPASLLTAATRSLPMSSLRSGAGNEVAISRGEGSGRLYYTAHVNAWVPAADARAVSRGITVARKYEAASCTPQPGKPCPAITTANVGDNIRVRLTLVAPKDLYFVRLSDTFPAGAEAVDSSLRTSQTAGVNRGTFGSLYGWGWWWWINRDIRDERLDLFAERLPRGTYEYVYTLRAGLAGSFQVIPTLVQEQGFPEVFGRSDGALFVIGAR